MSEYQYHEWQTIDRPLTPDEQAAVNRLSSHIEVSPNRAEVTYNWGDFKHDPKEVLLQYFDAYFYLTNWGSRRLMFRFPKGILDPDTITPYCDGEVVTFKTMGEFQVLDIDCNPEDGGDWVDEEEGNLSYFTPLRDDLLQGNYRLLYLAWLLVATHPCTGYEYEFEGEEDEDEYEEDGYEEAHEEGEEKDENPFEPPVPPGLKKLTPALQYFVREFGIDPFLVQAAAETSPDLGEAAAINYRELVARLPRAEVDDLLARLAAGDAGVRLALRKRLNEFVPKESPQVSPARPLQDLQSRAEQLKRLEKARKAEETRRKHIADMQGLAKKEEQTWKEVDELLENGAKSASVYDQATKTLARLKQLADFQKTQDAFYARVRYLASKYGSRPALMARWESRGWL